MKNHDLTHNHTRLIIDYLNFERKRIDLTLESIKREIGSAKENMEKIRKHYESTIHITPFLHLKERLNKQIELVGEYIKWHESFIPKSNNFNQSQYAFLRALFSGTHHQLNYKGHLALSEKRKKLIINNFILNSSARTLMYVVNPLLNAFKEAKKTLVDEIEKQEYESTDQPPEPISIQTDVNNFLDNVKEIIEYLQLQSNYLGEMSGQNKPVDAQKACSISNAYKFFLLTTLKRKLDN